MKKKRHPTLGKFEYRCRRCGKIDRSTITSASNVIVALVGAINDTDVLPASGIQVRMWDIHNCSDGGYGIADLLGCSVEETP